MDIDDILAVNLSVIIITLTAIIILQEEDEEKNKKKRKKRFWMKRILEKRHSEGTFNLLIPQLRSNDGHFKNFLRMSEDSYQLLLSLVEPLIRKQNTRLRRALTANEKLSLTLRYLATG